MKTPVYVDFSHQIRVWDGFGFNYVETAQTPDYNTDPQDYGGFSILSETDRQQIIHLVFGEDGLKPGVAKMFLDPFHQQEGKQNSTALEDINMDLYDHARSTRWMNYFIREGLKVTRARGADLEIITTLYGPPGWITKQRFHRGRDINPVYKVECAKYMVSWVKYLRETEMFPVNYISLHNEGEDYHRWPEDGSTANWEQGHDYNMYWPPDLVAEFLILVRKVLDAQRMYDVKVAPGECSNWTRFADWGYAETIAVNSDTVKSMGLITNHGFFGPEFGEWYGAHTSLGTDILRDIKPELHSWVTSTSWSKMDSKFIYEMKGNIYNGKNNAIIPWAGIQRASKWVGGDPNPGTAISILEDGTYRIKPGYYYYKQVCRAGQPGMAVTRANAADSEIGIIAFSNNGTKNPDAFVVINISNRDKELDLIIRGSSRVSFEGYRTSAEEKYSPIGKITLCSETVSYIAPAGSVTTFYGV